MSKVHQCKTFEQAVYALVQGLRIRRLSWPNNNYLKTDALTSIVEVEDDEEAYYVMCIADLKARDWVVC